MKQGDRFIYNEKIIGTVIKFDHSHVNFSWEIKDEFKSSSEVLTGISTTRIGSIDKTHWLENQYQQKLF